MKTVLTTGYTFAPAQRRVDFSAVPGFDARRLLAVIHGPSGRMIYAAATPALGYTALASGVLTLAFDTTTGMSASDALTVLYEADAFSPANPGHVALDAQAAGLALENGGHLAAIDGKLPALVNGKLPVAIDGEGVVLTGPVTVSNEVEIKNDSGNPIPVSGSVSVGNFPATQAISGTLAATQGGAWTVGLSAGTNAIGTVGVTALPALPAGSNVIGGVTQSGGPWSVSGTLSAAQSGPWTVAQGAAGATAWKVDGSAVTQPVSAVSLPLPAGAATSAKQDAAVAAIVAALAPLATDADLQANTAKAEAIRALLAGTLNVAASALPLPAGAASETKLEAVRALLAAALTVNLPAGAATDASLQSILTVLQAQRAETLWTDDTGAYFVRIDTRGTITWTDPSGNASSAPGTGARPAAGTSAIVDATRYQATASGPGYSTGDYLSHVVTTDPQSGVVIGHFWLNVTTETKLSASPSAANISPIAALPAGAATAARQDTGNASLASLDGKAPALVSGRVPVDGSAVVQPVSATSLPLPSGAATAAKQPALGTSGTPSTDVLTVQGIAGGAALPISATALPLPSGAAQDGSDPASPAVANAGTGIRGWLATVAGQLAGTLKAQLQAGSATIGSVNVLGGNTAAVKTDGSATTQPVSAASWPLPTGAATATGQASELTALTTINTTLTAPTPTSQAGPSLGVTNALGVVQQDGKPYTVSATSAAPLVGTGTDPTTGAILTDGYQSMSVQLTSAGSGNAVFLEESNDGSTWFVNNQGFLKNNLGSATTTGTIYSSTPSTFPLTMKYARFRVTTYGSGTVTIAAALKVGNLAMPSVFATLGPGSNTVGGVFEVGSSAAASAITPTVVQAGTALVGKASQGNLYSAYAVNSTTTAGYLVCINATAIPANGAAITPVDVATLAGAVGAQASINFGAGPGNAYPTGIVCLITTSLTTYTPGGNSFVQTRVR